MEPSVVSGQIMKCKLFVQIICTIKFAQIAVRMERSSVGANKEVQDDDWTVRRRAETCLSALTTLNQTKANKKMKTKFDQQPTTNLTNNQQQNKSDHTEPNQIKQQTTKFYQKEPNKKIRPHWTQANKN